ncbi:MAG: hypothetical protein JRI70_02890 [Deltaproteobacteria bacterium]|nr:hypothetical protein [Deltaproteobacteria bacterium]
MWPSFIRNGGFVNSLEGDHGTFDHVSHIDRSLPLHDPIDLQFQVEPVVDGTWKITDLKLLEEKRTDLYARRKA